MTIALVTLLVLISIAVLVYPFLTRRGAGELTAGPEEDAADQLRRARNRVYEEIRVLQQEYFLENLTEGEYHSQLQAARQRAAELIRRQQRVQETLRNAEVAVEEAMGRAGARPLDEAHPPEEPAPATEPRP